MDMARGVESLGYARMSQPPTSASPKVRRRKVRRKRVPVALPDQMWADLAYAARFATAAFKHSGDPESVSRNDFIEDSLTWALAAYWEDKGGEPSSEEEFEKKAKAHGAKLKAREAREQTAREAKEQSEQ